MSVVYNRGRARLAALGWTGLDVRALALADDDTLAAGAQDPALNTVAELLSVAGVTEAAGTGYARVALASKAVNEDDADNEVELDSDDLVFPAVDAGRWVAIVLYEEGASDAARNLLALYEPTTPLVTNGGDAGFTVDAEGLLYYRVL